MRRRAASGSLKLSGRLRTFHRSGGRSRWAAVDEEAEVAKALRPKSAENARFETSLAFLTRMRLQVRMSKGEGEGE